MNIAKYLNTSKRYFSNQETIQIINQLKGQTNTKSYVRNVIFDAEEQAFINAGYDLLTREVFIFPTVIQENCEILLKLYPFNVSERKLFAKIYTLKSIIHEINHAKQLKILIEDRNWLSYLYYLSIGLSDYKDAIKFDMTLKEFETILDITLDNHQEFYDLFGYISPLEKRAEALAVIKLKRSLIAIAKEIPNIMEYLDYLLLDSLTKGYDNLGYMDKYPFKTFLEERRDGDLVRTLPWHKDNYFQMMDDVKTKHSLTERMSLGLPATKEEINLVLTKLDDNQFKQL